MTRGNSAGTAPLDRSRGVACFSGKQVLHRAPEKRLKAVKNEKRGIRRTACRWKKSSRGKRASAPRQPTALHKHFRDLHRVGRRALAQVVGHHPEVEAVRHCRVTANAANEDLIPPLR